jgi:hypothetical protein
MKSEIDQNRQRKAMQWQKVRKESCENVGNKGFVNAGESADICETMEAKKPHHGRHGAAFLFN